MKKIFGFLCVFAVLLSAPMAFANNFTLLDRKYTNGQPHWSSYQCSNGVRFEVSASIGSSYMGPPTIRRQSISNANYDCAKSVEGGSGSDQLAENFCRCAR